jgi:inhibitor of KinA
MSNFTIFPLGDQAVTVSFGNSISEEQNNKVIALKNWIEANLFPGIRDLVVAYSSLTISYDPYKVKSQTSGTASQFVSTFLRDALTKISSQENKSPGEIRIPVCYDDPFSPDLEFICNETKLTREEIINIHSKRKYKIYMIGFLPGFPYMAEVDKRIAIPRKEKPRSLVEAGSVGIAGIQTGIYPVNSPGGWQIIGRTPLKLLSTSDQIPVEMEAGDMVEFYPITKEEFFKLQGSRLS